MKWTKEEISEVVGKINEKVQTDMEFRTLCLSDPAAAIKQISGKEIPAHFNVRFVENEGAHMTHVLPDYISQPSELTEVELEQVAGGRDGKVSHCTECSSTNLLRDQFGAFLCFDCGTGQLSSE